MYTSAAVAAAPHLHGHGLEIEQRHRWEERLELGVRDEARTGSVADVVRLLAEGPPAVEGGVDWEDAVCSVV
jgi:hypothetical protein